MKIHTITFTYMYVVCRECLHAWQGGFCWIRTCAAVTCCVRWSTHLHIWPGSFSISNVWRSIRNRCVRVSLVSKQQLSRRSLSDTLDCSAMRSSEATCTLAWVTAASSDNAMCSCCTLCSLYRAPNWCLHWPIPLPEIELHDLFFTRVTRTAEPVNYPACRFG